MAHLEKISHFFQVCCCFAICLNPSKVILFIRKNDLKYRDIAPLTLQRDIKCRLLSGINVSLINIYN